MTPEAAEAIRGLTTELRQLNVALSEQNKTSRRRLIRAMVVAGLAAALVLVVGVGMLVGLSVIQENQAEIKTLGQRQITETLRRERDVLEHRIKQEDCVVRPINEVIEKRINMRIDEPIELCDPEPALAQLERTGRRSTAPSRNAKPYTNNQEEPGEVPRRTVGHGRGCRRAAGRFSGPCRRDDRSVSAEALLSAVD